MSMGFFDVVKGKFREHQERAAAEQQQRRVQAQQDAAFEASVSAKAKVAGDAAYEKAMVKQAARVETERITAQANQKIQQFRAGGPQFGNGLAGTLARAGQIASMNNGPQMGGNMPSMGGGMSSGKSKRGVSLGNDMAPLELSNDMPAFPGFGYDQPRRKRR